MLKNEGSALVEVLLAAAFLAMIMVPLLNLLVTAVENSWFASRELRAQALARESWEALRLVRGRNWEEINDGTFYPDDATGTWKLVASETGGSVGPFNRKIVIEPVNRDENDIIVESGGTLDLSTKKVTLEVAWQSLRPRKLTYETFLTHHFNDFVWRQTTQAEFNGGELQYVETTSVDDGEVVLKGGCFENPAGAWIFDDEFQNTWGIHESAGNDIQIVTQPPGQVYDGEKALELSDFNGSSTKLRNGDNVCTIGFTRIEFYAYNSAEVEQTFQMGGNWAGGFVNVTLPPQSWEFVSLSYTDVVGGDETNMNFIFFKPGADYQPGTLFYLDNFTLEGGIGGYYAQGTLTSSVFDAGRQTTFNRISFDASLPLQTAVGFQVAISADPDGPWLFYGPNGTTSESDLYTNAEGEGLWLGGNYGRYCRYKAYLFTYDGENTPVVEEVRINYIP
jgi:hypothetical protein